MKLYQLILAAFLILGLGTEGFAVKRVSTGKTKTSVKSKTSKKKKLRSKKTKKKSLAKKKKRSKVKRSRLAKKSKSRSKLRRKRVKRSRVFYNLAPVLGMSNFVIIGDSTKNFEYDTGMTGGLAGEVGKGRWSFETGIIMSEANTKADEIETVVDNTLLKGTDGELKMKFLGIPLLGKVRLMPGQAFQLFFKGGLMPVMLQSADFDGKIAGQSVSTDVKDTFNDSDIFAVAGGGMQYNFNRKMALFLEGSYLRGITDISSTDGTINMQGYSVVLGLNIGI